MTASFAYTVDVGSEGDVALTGADGEGIALSEIQRRIVAALAGRPESEIEDLIEAVWGADAPASASASLHNHLSRLRSRAPDLVVRRHERYSLAATVRRASEPAATDDAGDGSGPVDAIDDLRGRAGADPYDERARAEFVSALAAAGRHAEAADALDEARRDLATVGLEPGRRLTDLARMVADGERRVDRLDGHLDAGADIGLTLGTFSVDHVIAAARRWIRQDGDAMLVVAGTSGSGRTHALRVIRDIAIGVGFDVAELRCATVSTLPVLPTGDWDGRAPRLLTVDDVDQVGGATERVLHRLLADRRRGAIKVVAAADPRQAGRVTDELGAAFGRPLTTDRIELHTWSSAQRTALLDRLELESTARERLASTLDDLERLGLSNRACLDAIRLATGSSHDRSEFERIMATRSVIVSVDGSLDRSLVTAMLSSLDPAARELIDIAGCSVTPFLLDDVVELVPDLRQHLRRREVRRLLDLDDVTGRVTTRDGLVDAVVLDGLSPRRRVELNTRLAEAGYPHEPAHLRARRHAAHAAEADLSPVQAAASISSFAEVVAATGDRLTAADVARLAADRVLSMDPARYCELAVRSGAELLAAGDPSGLESLSNAVEIAIANQLASEAAAAVRVYCELGPTSGAGHVDAHAARLIETVEPMLSTDRDRARVLSASTMVHALSGDAERCIERYERSIVHAEATGDDHVLAEALPFAFLSLAAPEFLERREDIAERMHVLAERTGRADTRWEALHLELSNQLQRGDPRARTTLEALRDATAAVGGASHDWELTYLAAVIAHVDGDLAATRRLADESLVVGGAVGETRRLAVYGSLVLGCHLAEGSVPDLLPMFEQMVLDQPLLAAWRAPLALALAELGRSDEALDAIDAVAAPGAIERDCTASAVGLVAGEAVGAIAAHAPDDEQHERAMASARQLVELMTPWSGRWSWTGAASFGPIDTTLAKLHHVLGHQDRALSLAAGAARQAATMRAPVHARAAARLLTDITAT